MTPDKMTEAVERFARLEHDRWSRWHKYAKENWTPEKVARWDKLAATPYELLTEELKQKDRDEVYPYLECLEQERERAKGLVELLRKLHGILPHPLSWTNEHMQVVHEVEELLAEYKSQEKS